MTVRYKEIGLVLLIVLSLFAAVFVTCLVIPLAIFIPGILRNFGELVLYSWTVYLTALIRATGTKSFVTGDHLNVDEHSIVVMNHQSNIDWLFISSSMIQAQWPSKGRRGAKYILKDVIRHYPGAGWVIQMIGGLFIKRDWNIDKQRFVNYLNYYFDLGHTVQMYIFPEGTIMHPITLKRSHKFAEEHGLPQYHYTLHPRTTGFCFMAKHMLSRKSLNAIYDITVGYVGKIPETELQILTGGLPEEVQFKIRRYPIEELSHTDEGLEKWLQELWRNKENEMMEFEKTKRLSEEFEKSQISYLSLGLAVIGWAGLSCLMIYLLFLSRLFRIYALGCCLFFVGLSFFSEGFLDLEIWWYYYKLKSMYV